MATNKDDRSLAEELTNGVLEKLANQGFSIEKEKKSLESLVFLLPVLIGSYIVAQLRILLQCLREKILNLDIGLVNFYIQ